MKIFSPGFFLLAWLLAASAAAAPRSIDYARSSLKFQAVQQDAKFTGEFPEFLAEIQLDPSAQNLGLQIRASVVMSAVDTAYAERDDYLRSEEFFHASQFPQATFQSTQASRVENGVLTQGSLTIKETSHPIEMLFQFDPASQRLQGTAQISRLRFTVGTGMWEDTTWIADEVGIVVDIFFDDQPAP